MRRLSSEEVLVFAYCLQIHFTLKNGVSHKTSYVYTAKEGQSSSMREGTFWSLIGNSWRYFVYFLDTLMKSSQVFSQWIRPLYTDSGDHLVNKQCAHRTLTHSLTLIHSLLQAEHKQGSIISET